MAICCPCCFVAKGIPSTTAMYFVLFATTMATITLACLGTIKVFYRGPGGTLIFFKFTTMRSKDLLFVLLADTSVCCATIVDKIYFLSLFVVFSLTTCRGGGATTGYTSFFFTNVSLILAIVSEPGVTLVSIIVIPLCLGILYHGGVGAGIGLLSILSFTLPIFIKTTFRV